MKKRIPTLDDFINEKLSFNFFKKNIKKDPRFDKIEASDTILKKYSGEFTNLGYDENGNLIGNHKTDGNGIKVLSYMAKKEKLKESVEGDAIYDETLDDDYWNEISDKFPDYNNPGSYDHVNAVEWILNRMKDEYDNIEWEKYEDEIRSKIKDGLT